MRHVSRRGTEVLLATLALATAACSTGRIADLAVDPAAVVAAFDQMHDPTACKEGERRPARGCNRLCKPCALEVCIDGKWLLKQYVPGEEAGFCEHPPTLQLCPLDYETRQCAGGCDACYTL